MDLKLFHDILSVDSTSGQERDMALYLADRLMEEGSCGVPGKPKCKVEKLEVGDGTLNLRLSWGNPDFFFCTHMDTVPPYIPPSISGNIVFGRGSCDAKGQILSMFTACRTLESMGKTNFGLLVFAGEETGSFGAKAYDRDFPGAGTVVVGEPTDNCMVSASKGTKAFEVTIKGRSCHSGYPENGVSAVDRFVDFVNGLRGVDFPEDPLSGKTTWNIGKLSSDNPQNILSPEVRFRLYFRTTFSSDSIVQERMASLRSSDIGIEALGGDTPMSYWTLPEIPSKTVAFGSDAPRLSKFERRALCGPGSILVAHTSEEHVLISDLEKAVGQYVYIFEKRKR